MWVPGLKDRVEEIVPLAMELMKKYAQEGKNVPVFTNDAINILQNYKWPGNVRELENVIQRALILQQNGQILPEQIVFEDEMTNQLEYVESSISDETLPTMVPIQGGDKISLGDSVRSAEENIILQTLQDEKGSRKVTAEKLGISPRTLRYKIARMKESGIPIPC